MQHLESQFSDPTNHTGHGCSKTILVGEHAVVYGSRAIAIPLKQLRTDIFLESSLKNELTFISNEISDKILPVIHKAFELLGGKFENVKISGKSTIPIGSGLGSSASLCVSLIKAIAKYLNHELNENKVSLLANELEKNFHGNPSGIDTTVISHEKIVLFKKEEDPVLLNIDGYESDEHFLNFAIIDSNMKASTEEMIKIAKPFFTGPEGRQNVQIFDEIVSNTLTAISKRDASEIACLMNQCQKLLKASGVSNDHIERIIQFSLELGCHAAKITGAGGGGCILVLLDAKRKKSQINKLKDKFGTHHVYEVNL